jgi:hypothetical protein
MSTAYLTGGMLPIQGPPGAGKTFTGARMICELVVRRGKTVGITANSHKVIDNLIDATIHAAELGIDLQRCQKADEVEAPQHRLTLRCANAADAGKDAYRVTTRSEPCTANRDERSTGYTKPCTQEHMLRAKPRCSCVGGEVRGVNPSRALGVAVLKLALSR